MPLILFKINYTQSLDGDMAATTGGNGNRELAAINCADNAAAPECATLIKGGKFSYFVRPVNFKLIHWISGKNLRAFDFLIIGQTYVKWDIENWIFIDINWRCLKTLV